MDGRHALPSQLWSRARPTPGGRRQARTMTILQKAVALLQRRKAGIQFLQRPDLNITNVMPHQDGAMITSQGTLLLIIRNAALPRPPQLSFEFVHGAMVRVGHALRPSGSTTIPSHSQIYLGLSTTTGACNIQSHPAKWTSVVDGKIYRYVLVVTTRVTH